MSHLNLEGTPLSYYVVEPPPPRRIRRPHAVAASLLLLLLAFASGWTAIRPVKVNFDGRLVSVPPGSTVQEALDKGWLTCTPGDLLAVDGSIIDYGGGESPTVVRNGSPAGMSQRLYHGDVVEGYSGESKQESVITTQVPVPFRTRYEGRGPLSRLKVLGAPGVRRVTRGEYSGFEVTSTLLVEPSDMVIVRHRPMTGRLVALTFDDGPFPGQTERILYTLAKHDVKATFFLLGVQITRNPALARRVVRHGHAVGSHTYWHDRLDLMSPARSRAEVLGGRRALAKATGVSSKWLRAPYGGMDASAWRTVRSLKMVEVGWDVDSRDWTRPGAKQIAAIVLRDTRPGSVILMHDGGGDRVQTAQALNIIIPALKRKGYTFVTLDELDEARREARRRATARNAAHQPKPAPRPGG